MVHTVRVQVPFLASIKTVRRVYDLPFFFVINLTKIAGSLDLIFQKRRIHKSKDINALAQTFLMMDINSTVIVIYPFIPVQIAYLILYKNILYR